MSEKPHTVAIGAFVLGAMLIAVTIIIFALGTGFGQQTEKVVMVFDGSVKGLNVGALVALRGVQIGQVTKVELMLDADNLDLTMLVEARLNNENIRRLGHSTKNVTDGLIARGMRAQLKTQSLLTGLLYIQFDFHPDKPPVLVPIDSDYLQIPTIPTELELLTRKIEELDFASLVDRLDGIVSGLNTFVTSDATQALPIKLESTLASLESLSDGLRTQLASSGPKLDTVLAGLDTTVSSANQELPKLAALAGDNLAVLEGAISAFEKTMTNIDSLVAPGSATAYQMNIALRELALAGQAIQQLADLLDRQPESLLRGKREDTE